MTPLKPRNKTPENRAIDWISLGFSAPWLVYLGYIYDGLLEPNAPVWKPVYVIICLVIFSITDVAAYTVPWILPASSYFRRLLLWTVLLLVPVCGVMLIAAIPPADVLIGFTIYFVALWTFAEDIPYSTRIRGAFILAAAFWGIYILSDGFPINFADKSRLTLSLGIPMIGIMAFSYLIQLSKNADKTQAKLEMVSERERIAHDVHDVLGHSLTVPMRSLKLSPSFLGLRWRRFVRRSRGCASRIFRVKFRRRRVPCRRRRSPLNCPMRNVLSQWLG